MPDDDEGYDDRPVRVSGHAFEGWRLALNRHAVGTLFSSSDEAQAATVDLSEHPLKWVQRITDPKGNAYFEGAHPDILDHEARHKHSGSNPESSKAESEESQQLLEKLGHKPWWDRWYVEPEYSAIYTPVSGAIRPLPQSRFYAAPYLTDWGVWHEGLSEPTEGWLTREEALEAATRLALGLKTRRQVKRLWREGLGIVALIIVTVLLLLIVNG